jgi:glycosyltransferase involved in cell wall biosynthesis
LPKKVKLVVGADLNRTAGGIKVERVLEAFKELVDERPDATLILATRRHRTDYFNAFEWIDRARLWNKVKFIPHYDICREFPIRKSECDVWIDDDTCDFDLTAHGINLEAEKKGTRARKALFVTSYHPAKPAGNSALMRQWLKHLNGAGYSIDLVYYAMDKDTVDPQFLERDGWSYGRLIEVPVETPLVGANTTNLNLHVDDWCGPELCDAVDDLVSKNSYDVAIVNYVFLSATFLRIPAFTHRILLTHDRFADRNRRMLADGFTNAGWVSLDVAGEALGCRRADTVIALQDFEAAEFKSLIGPTSDVRVVSPVPPGSPVVRSAETERLRVGCLGSGNRVNETSLADLLSYWADNEVLLEKAELIVGGGLCDRLAAFVTKDVLARAKPRLVGSVDTLADFYENCDVVINPERGGTGIKIKSLDAMAHGMPLLSTVAGAIGLQSISEFHNIPDNAELARKIAEIAKDRTLLRGVQLETKGAWNFYLAKHRQALVELLGPEVDTSSQSGTDDHANSPVSHLKRYSKLQRFVFEPNGNPVPLLKAVLFNSTGEPRKFLRRIVLKKSGKPRPAFQEWFMQKRRK